MMRVLVRLTMAFACVAVAAAGVGAATPRLEVTQPPPSGKQDPRALALIQQAAAAIGGAEALKGVKDFTAAGTVKMATPMGEMTAESLGEVVYPDKSRQTIDLPMGRMVQAIEGDAAWIKMDTQVLDVPPEMIGEMKRGIVTAGGIELLRRALSGAAGVEWLEPATVDGRATDVVRWRSGELEVRIFLDAQTHLISKLAYRAAAPGAPAPVDVEVVTTDFREVSGMKFPFRVVGYQNGQQNFEMTASSVKVNSGIAPAGFAKPAR